MVSFGRTDAQKKQHKERSQPFNRQRFGLLEKKKDYVLRSKDYQSKQQRLKTLRSKAAFKNEDEFYFGMVNAKTKKGVAVKDRGNQALSQDITKVLKTQDSGYIKTIASIERKKVEALKQAQHIPVSLPEDEKPKTDGRSHSVFVENVQEMRSLDPVERLHTTASNLPRTANRAPVDPEIAMDPAARLLRRKMRAAKLQQAREMNSRLQRIEKLGIMEKETALHRQLMGKGQRKKVGIDKDGVARYKWKQERRK